MTKPTSEIKIEHLTAIIDAREQMPCRLDPLMSERGTLATGDYSLVGFENQIAIERKSLPDLVACCGVERERFEREIQRLLAYPSRAIVVEATWAMIEAGGWRSKLQPSHVMGSVLGWIDAGVPVLLVRDHEAAGKAIARLLFIAARRRWRALQSLHRGLKIVEEAS